MDWVTWIVIGVVVAGFILLKRAGQISAGLAGDLLRRGARVIDVRGESEFQTGHLPGAINIPLGRLSDEIERHAPDKEQPLLLHCLSGGRSGIGMGVLRRMGYRNCHNLGSYGRARKLVETSAAAPTGP
jgi:phage shock protein E